MSDPTAVDPVFQAISAAHWYALSGLIVGFVLAVLRKQTTLLHKLAAWQQYAIGLGMMGGGAFVTAQAGGHPLSYALTATVVAVLSAAGGLMPGVGHGDAVKAAVVLVLLAIPFTSGCAAIKPIIHTLNDVARLDCQAWASGKFNVPIDAQKVQEFCAVQSNLDPFIALVTSQQKAGKAGLPPAKMGCGELAQ